MSDSPPLVSAALRFLFRHLSQRHEVLQTCKQVQLLVSDSDVANKAKQISTVCISGWSNPKSLGQKGQNGHGRERSRMSSSQIQRMLDIKYDAIRTSNLTKL
ncbi:hypothetical protein DAPPUDRAFT_240578 [Daphnia pulex]|uniref:Uncharacterized protein n=1 Tax=Daphnia pulex TaxID=6669 RepID=E9GBW1_DAPPU|nr:hypothetical protein DAPPUDRAFT_240578 [Daphnia pulex]|eukprot:EFX83028.1 hypothetical protein DAPPUDRAFT_240578 [Daphnia pulex]